eukprot:CAMPEP_0118907084 /NCGR_PEP_ID=MMETSP1166-20130328/10693_1 /TAXON_ID=1104430 /ORGANISM="Chrysoreinhardia sp, Strain CCMP3193" /LENGTH=170 /DNA_ID=CAMNT_0006846443 /DNA_START=6 /DNA_END=518 /DNA_ORIENTATION=+
MSSSSSGAPAAPPGSSASAGYFPGDLAHAELASFLTRIREYESTVPEEVCRYYMLEGGVEIAEEADQELILKLVSIATDHFLAGVVHDASEFAQLRGDPSRKCLRTRDVMLALQRRGVTTLHAPTEEETKVQQAQVAKGAVPTTKRQRDTADDDQPNPKRHHHDGTATRS